MMFERLKFLLIILFCNFIIDSITVIVADENISTMPLKADTSPVTKNTLIISSSKLEYFPIEYTSVFETNDNKLDIEDINFLGEKYWKPLTPDFKFNPRTIYWLKLDLQLDDKDKQAQILEWIITPGFWFNAMIL